MKGPWVPAYSPIFHKYGVERKPDAEKPLTWNNRELYCGSYFCEDQQTAQQLADDLNLEEQSAPRKVIPGCCPFNSGVCCHRNCSVTSPQRQCGWNPVIAERRLKDRFTKKMIAVLKNIPIIADEN